MSCWRCKCPSCVAEYAVRTCECGVVIRREYRADAKTCSATCRKRRHRRKLRRDREQRRKRDEAARDASTPKRDPKRHGSSRTRDPALKAQRELVKPPAKPRDVRANRSEEV